nr:hypothetical protein Iba_chr03dCG0360 [Ipomoea batatas]
MWRTWGSHVFCLTLGLHDKTPAHAASLQELHCSLTGGSSLLNMWFLWLAFVSMRLVRIVNGLH